MRARAGSGCLVLFGIPFAGVGVFMTGMLFYLIIQSLMMSSWEETPATVVSANLESHSGSKGGTTYKVKARYKYEYGGQSYESSRVHIGSMAMMSKEQRKQFNTLDGARKAKKTVTCYVDPNDPSEAVLNRSLSMAAVAMCLVFGLVFGGAETPSCGFAIGFDRVLEVCAAEPPHEPRGLPYRAK